MIKHVLVSLLLMQLCISSHAQIERTREFVNFDKGGAFVHCFFQDDKGVIWMGTSNGLGMFDGQKVRRHKLQDANDVLEGAFVYCTLKQDNVHFYLGTEKGLCLLDLKSNTCQLFPSPAVSIRAIEQMNDSILLLGTLDGLGKYNIRQNTFQSIDKMPQLPTNPITRLDESHFLIANYHGLYLYDEIKDTYEYLSMPSKESSLIFSTVVDSDNQWVWVGTENGLWKYGISSGELTRVTSFPSTPVKNMHISADGLLWLGTDNGLYIYDWHLNRYEHAVHSSLNTKSLVNNIIWNIFEDRDGNIWLGTSSGISLYYNSRMVETYSWDNLVRSDEGNDIYCIYRDSRNNYWWGGSNGLCYYNPVKNKSLWFKMNRGRYSISHNRIRHIYEDWDKDLWIATDGGINRFDYETETFENYQITDSTHTRNANWTYYINSDNHSNIYLVAYCGGVFVVNKEKLLSQKGKLYVADENYYHHSGENSLHSNFVSHATIDNDGCLWVPSGENYLEKIDFKEKKVYSYHLSDEGTNVPEGSITKIIHDESGDIWLSMTNGLCRITTHSRKIEVIDNAIFDNKEIRLLEDAGDRLWIGTSEGVYAYDKVTGTFIYSGIGGSWLSLYNDREAHKIWVGGIDQCLAFRGDELLKERKNKGSLVLSKLYVNDKAVNAHEAYDKNVIATQNINFVEQIHLLHNQNNIAFDFLHTQYDRILKSHYKYRLKGVDKDWRGIEDLSIRISYSNLEPGTYDFEIKELAADDSERDAASFHLNIVVDSPWYRTNWAKTVYILFACLLILGVIKYFKDKNRFRIERIEKEKTLELSDLKMEFLTHMSHELKTPLSLIISPVSKLLTEAKSTHMKESLSLIHENALKLNRMVHQILNIKDWAGSQRELYLSQLEFVSFMDGMVKNYRENMKDRDIIFYFSSDVEQCFIEADIAKMEAVVDNLLSNACKFLMKEGKIDVSLQLTDDEADESRKICLKVADNGVGIPAHDLPHIFDRFYQADNSRKMNEEGSGIGLFIVKTNVELHHGEISVTSEEGKGTVISLFIPVVQKVKPFQDTDICLALNTGEPSRCKVLIVEDNVEITQFIKNSLHNTECLLAYNGKIGMEMAQQHSPDIIIADIMMPVMNGIEMVKQLKTNLKTSTIPVIMLTAKDDKKTEYNLLSLGVEAFIAKPFDIKELVAHIDKVLRNKYRLVRKLKEEGISLETDTVITESQDEKFLTYITEVIEQNLSNADLNVTKLAELSGYHSKQIYRRVKQLTGYTTVDYIKAIRMKKAAMLLAKKQFMISEVMYMVGFSDSSYFSKCFVEKYGRTPKQYMESL